MHRWSLDWLHPVYQVREPSGVQSQAGASLPRHMSKPLQTMGSLTIKPISLLVPLLLRPLRDLTIIDVSLVLPAMPIRLQSPHNQLPLLYGSETPENKIYFYWFTYL